MDGITERPGSLARGAATITVATFVSRVTGLLRIVVVASAMGTTFLANTYQTANTVPNLLFELVAAGVLTSVFVPTFMDYLVRGRRDEGWRAGDALTSIALLGLSGVALLMALLAPWIMRVLTIGVDDASLRAAEIALGTSFLRLFAPQVVLYGAGMIMTGALHAHRRFGMAAVAPIFNNLVVIATYLAYAAMRGPRDPSVAAITDAQIWVLGGGTTLGVAVMTLCLVPSLHRLGWRFRFRFDPRHPAVRRAMRLGVWALSYAGGYQAGLIVVLVLANQVEGGVAAYQWAYTFFYVPHALFAAPIFHVLFPAMTEHHARGDLEGLMRRLRAGVAMLAFVTLPIAAFLVVAAGPLIESVLSFGVMSETGTILVARVLAGFALGLPTYSAFLVMTRAFYALGDTRTPALVNLAAIVLFSASGVVLFGIAPEGWSVPALALAHSAAFAAGTALLTPLLVRRTTPILSDALRSSLRRSLLVTLAAVAAMLTVAAALPGDYRFPIASATAIGLSGGVVYVGAMVALRSQELARIRDAVRRRPS